ncbi:unnamed protein product [marine sediment metagenome]|uniref:Uncharacterized protein n=1 Tax=marine sediment metagenome TaxID=412755 RepID=X1QNW1_9ZZZZ
MEKVFEVKKKCPNCGSELEGPTITDDPLTSGLYWCRKCEKSYRPTYKIDFIAFIEIKKTKKKENP